MLALKSILHPTDFSPQAERAFEFACSLARDHRSRLILLHVEPGREVLLGQLGMPPGRGNGQAAREQLEQLAAAAPALAVECVVVQGDPAEQILAAARDRGCELIVMGTHGRSGLSRLLTGSVAERVMREATCPVLTVKGLAVEPAVLPAHAVAGARP